MHTIRLATIADIARMAQIEALCFPAAEAAPLDAFKKRFAVFPECFFVLEVDGVILGHINGCVHCAPELPDALYADPQLHRPDGAYQTVFGLVVTPQYQRRGYATALTRHLVDVSRERGRKGVILTCKDYLVDFYQRLGFVHRGVSASSHGGASWNDMLLTF